MNVTVPLELNKLHLVLKETRLVGELMPSSVVCGVNKASGQVGRAHD